MTVLADEMTCKSEVNSQWLTS